MYMCMRVSVPISPDYFQIENDSMKVRHLRTDGLTDDASKKRRLNILAIDLWSENLRLFFPIPIFGSLEVLAIT